MSLGLEKYFSHRPLYTWGGTGDYRQLGRFQVHSSRTACFSSGKWIGVVQRHLNEMRIKNKRFTAFWPWGYFTKKSACRPVYKSFPKHSKKYSCHQHRILTTKFASYAILVLLQRTNIVINNFGFENFLLIPIKCIE